MKKRILSLLLVICMVTVFMPCVAMAMAWTVDGHVEEGIDVMAVISDGKATLHGVSGSISGDFTIPSTIAGYPLVAIEVGAFMYFKNLTSVVIPNSVTDFCGGNVFYGCTNLKSVVIPDSVTSPIRNYMFGECSSLTSIYIGRNVSNIGAGAFYGCNSLTEVYYAGSKLDWDNLIKEDLDNECLTNATIHYNYGTSVSNVSIFTPETMKVGEQYRIYGYCSPYNAYDTKLTWSSSNNAVVSVNSNGYAVAKAPGTAKITARSSNGKTASGTITVMEENVIDYDNFKYSFGNSDSSFGYDKYLFGYKIPKERYMQLGFEKSKAKTMVSKWGGNCFGMSTSSMLFYKNILQEERYNEDVHTPFEFEAPNAGNNAFLSDKWEVKLRRMIELMQVSQHLDGWKGWMKDRITEIDDVIKYEIDNGNPVLLCMNGYKKNNKSETGGHAVVIYDYDYSDIGMRLYIYDCSGFVDSALYQEGDTDFAFHYLKDTWVWKLDYIISCDEISGKYNYIYNLNSNNASSLFSLTNEPTYTYIIRPAEDMTITNSSGQVSTIIDGEISGEIEDIRVVPDSYLAVNPKYTIIAPTDTYTITGTSEDTVETVMADDYMSASVTSTASTPITVSSDLYNINVENESEAEYSITYTTYDNIFDEMTLSGTAYGEVSTELDGTNVNVSGAKTINASATISEKAVDTNAELSEGQNAVVECVKTSGESTTIQIKSDDTALTEAAALPERTQVSVPEYDLESGTYTEGQMLTFTKDDETIIYYTTDGSIPSQDNGLLYSLPIDINKSMTIKAIATRYGYTDSEIIELTYELPSVSAPYADKPSGAYDEVISVAFALEDEETEIYYTLDGSDPYENGIRYGSAIVITEDTLIRAYATKNGCVSEISEYEYEVASKYPLHIVNTPTNQDSEIITAENLSSVTRVDFNIKNMSGTVQNGVFILAFYNDKNELVCAKYKSDEVSLETDTVSIDINEPVSGASKMKLFAWNTIDTMIPLMNATEYEIN